MYSRIRAIVLRKINGVLEACFSGDKMRSGGAAVLRAPSLSGMTAALGAFSFALLLPIVALALTVCALLFGGVDGLLLATAPAAVTAADVEKVGNKLMTAFNEFKAQNDKELSEIRASGSASAETRAQVERINAEMNTLTAELTELRAALREQEVNAARVAPVSAGDQRERDVLNARAFFSMTRGQPVENVSDDDLTAYREYRSAINHYLRRGEKAIADTRIKAALSTGSAPDGGIWLTPEQSGRIVELLYATSPVRSLARVETIGTDTYEGVYDLDEGSSGGWVGEKSPRVETATPKAEGKWQIPVYEQYANPATTQKMLDDINFDVEAWLAQKTSRKMTRVENTAFVGGDGVEKPRGFLTYSSAKPTKDAFRVIEAIKSGAAGAFAASSASVSPIDAVIDLVTALKAEWRNGAAFTMNSVTLAVVRKLKDAQGNYLFMPNFGQGAGRVESGLGAALGTGTGEMTPALAAGSLMGFPIFEFADMPDIAANSLSIAFANWKEAYTIVDHRVGVRVLRDNLTNKPYIHYYTTKRVGGDVVNFDAIKLMKFSA